MADAADLAAAARSCDGIFHLAAIASVPRCLAEPERARAVNLGGARNAIAAARRPGAAPGVVREESETRPISGYGAEKLAGERLAAQAAGVGAARAPRFDAFNVCTGRATTLQGLLEAMARRAGRTPRVLRAPPRPGDIRVSAGDPSAARRALGVVAATGLEQGLAALPVGGAGA